MRDTEVVPITARFFAVWLKGTDVTLFWKEHQKPTRFCVPEAELEGRTPAWR
jgi:hypothetical protein